MEKKIKNERKNTVLKMPENINSVVEKYEFKLDNEKGLKYVSDTALEMAFLLIKEGNIKLTYKEAKSEEYYPELNISSTLSNFCKFKMTSEELLEDLKSNMQKYIVDKNDWEITCKPDTIDSVCRDCKYDKCPKAIASYILYLYSNGELDKKLKEREDFRKKNKTNNKFDFVWNVEDGLKYVDDKTYDFCKKLVDENKIWVPNILTEEGFVKIDSLYTCEEYKKINNDIEKIPKPKRDFNNCMYIERDTDMKFKFCEKYECRLDKCIYEVAGYIYYLQREGLYDQIEADRIYYKEHKKEVDLQILKDKEEKLQSQNESKNNMLDIFEEFKGKVENINSIVETISSVSQKNFHCILEGNDQETQENLVNEIAEQLYKKEKIVSNEIVKLSMQNLASYNTYITSYDIDKNDKNGVPYRVEDAVKYTELEEEKLYVINGVAEFVADYRKFKENIDRDLRNKQFNHVLDLLTKMEAENYIVILATEKETQELLALEPKLKFIYQNYIYKVKDLSLDEIYELYVSKIKLDLLEDLRKNDKKYKKEFKDYVSLNQKFIPFSNRELASYLADYSNSKNKIVFPKNMYKKETVEESLSNIIGLEALKKKVKEFEKYMLFRVRAEANGLKLKNTNMHMVFTGNPGTGKTTIARIMAKMLFDLGIIKENKLIEVEYKDLIASYIGQTAPKTAEVISKAMGGVLFIDEAYSLAQGSKDGGNSFGPEAIATLVKAMEDHKGELVVIFAGYKDEMKTFIDSNPGISSRIGYTFDFPDYEPSELVKIFTLKIQNMGFKCEKGVEELVENICEYFSKRKAFGNGRFVDKIIQETIMNHALNEGKIELICKKDIPTIEELLNTGNNVKGESLKLLNDIIGMKDLKEKIKEFEDYVIFQNKAKSSGINLKETNMNMLFIGNSGTGKTTIARIMAKLLFDLGVIKENKLIEVAKKDLVGQYVGQTAPKTAEVIEKALGGVLFIDEAYSLTEGKDSFGLESLETLIKAMEDHKGEFVVIFAGYRNKMQEFIDSNPGLASRIGYTFEFPDYDEYELADILYKKIEQCDLKLEDKAKDEIASIMKYFCNVENIGNGRFADKVLQEILIKHAKNYKDDIQTIKEEDIPTIKEMIEVVFNGSYMTDPTTITNETRERVATHEVGHALIRLLLFKKPGIKRITVNPEGDGTLGYVLHSSDPDKPIRTRTEILNDIKVSMAGMAAEQVYFGEFSNGNSSDLKQATLEAENMVKLYGMSDLGFGQISNPEEKVEKEIRVEVNKILEEAFNGAVRLIKDNKRKMDNVIKYLLANREITEEEFIKNLK